MPVLNSLGMHAQTNDVISGTDEACPFLNRRGAGYVTVKSINEQLYARDCCSISKLRTFLHFHYLSAVI